MDVASGAVLPQLAAAHPNFTVAFWLKLVPVIVTDSPTTPEFELNPEIVGAGTDASTVNGCGL